MLTSNTIFSELKRRNVFRVASVYGITSWLLAQMAGVLETSMNMPGWFDTVVVSFLLIGFPIAIILAWAFEVSPEGVKRTEAVSPDESIVDKTGRMLDYALLAGLLVVALLVFGNRFAPSNLGIQSNTSNDAGINEFAGQSIAVLPFEDFSADKDQAYFADGIAEELLNVLARVDGLRVASRTSAFSFKEREVSIAEIAEALNVEHILEGSVRKAGNTLRITAQLIDTKTDQHMWSETYDRPLTAENIFEIQDEISSAIVLELNGRLDLLPEMNDRPTQSTEAFDAYLKGISAYVSRTTQALDESIDWLILAVTLDPEFAVAHAKLARAYTLSMEYANLELDHAQFRSRIHIERALKIAPENWDILSEKAWVTYITEVPIEEKIAAFDLAIAANQNNAEAHRGRGLLLLHNHQFESALSSLNLAYRLNPQSAITLINLGGVYVQRDDLEAAAATVFKALQIEPTLAPAQAFLGWGYLDEGRIEEAHPVLKSCEHSNGCKFALTLLYADLSMDEQLSEIDFGLAEQFQLLMNAQVEEYQEYMEQQLKDQPTNLLSGYVLAGLAKEAYQVIQDNPQTFVSFIDGLVENGLDSNGLQLSILWTLEQVNDPRASKIKAVLAQRFNGFKPQLNNSNMSYLLTAQWHMAKGDFDGAVTWLTAMAERGAPLRDFEIESHWFEPLFNRPDYQAFKQLNESNQTRFRELIEAQLADPPKAWWTPDELPEASN